MCVILLGCCTCIGALWPQVGFVRALSVYPPFAQLLAFPLALGAGLMLLGVCAALLCLYKRKAQLTIATCVVWVIAGAGFMVAPYGLPRQVEDSEHAVTENRHLTIVSFNTGSTLSVSDFQQLVTMWDPDVIVLPETAGHEIRRAMTISHYRGTLFETRRDGLPNTYTGSIAPTSLIVSDRLGPAHAVKAPVTSFGTVAVEFNDTALPMIVGLHTAPPLPGLMEQWRSDIDRVFEFSESTKKSLIVAGDFNATLRHGALAARNALVDSQEFCSSPQKGTWPTGTPSIMRAPIDHVFVTQGMRASSCHVQEIGRSDHLAYKTQVSLP